MFSLIIATAVAASLTNPLNPAPPPVELIHSISSQPFAGLLRDNAGNFYGTTETGGAFKGGNVFKLAPDGTYSSIYDFTQGSDGGYPRSDLVRDASGNLYGTTSVGGGCAALGQGCGVVFKVAPNGTETVLHAFAGTAGNDGELPYAGVVMDANGNLYGTTYLGGLASCPNDGDDGCGTVFKVTPSGAETILHAFTCADGCQPFAGVILDKTGNLYGSTSSSNGGIGGGNIFEITADGTFKVLYAFVSDDDGFPLGRLVRDAGGNLYGTTSYGGGANGYGTVFKLAPDGSKTILHSFNSTDGAYPAAGLIRDRSGNLYGTTASGGDRNCGTVFKLSPDGQEMTLHAFFPNFNIDGCQPFGELLRTNNGNLYGTTYSGGVGDMGTVFVVTP